jgi:hypothetical protein
MAIQDAIERIQYHAATLIPASPNDPDFSIESNNLSVLTYLGSGSFGTEAANQGRDLHNIIAQLTSVGGDEANLFRQVEGKLEAFINLLRGDVTLNGTVETINGPITYSVSLTGPDNALKLSYIITIPIKIRPVF